MFFIEDYKDSPTNFIDCIMIHLTHEHEESWSA